MRPKGARNPEAAYFLPTTAAARASFRKRKCTKVRLGFQDGGPQCVGVRLWAAVPRAPGRPGRDQLGSASSSRIQGRWVPGPDDLPKLRRAAEFAFSRARAPLPPFPSRGYETPEMLARPWCLKPPSGPWYCYLTSRFSWVSSWEGAGGEDREKSLFCRQEQKKSLSHC